MILTLSQANSGELLMKLCAFCNESKPERDVSGSWKVTSFVNMSGGIWAPGPHMLSNRSARVSANSSVAESGTSPSDSFAAAAGIGEELSPAPDATATPLCLRYAPGRPLGSSEEGRTLDEMDNDEGCTRNLAEAAWGGANASHDAATAASTASPTRCRDIFEIQRQCLVLLPLQAPSTCASWSFVFAIPRTF